VHRIPAAPAVGVGEPASLQGNVLAEGHDDQARPVRLELATTFAISAGS